MNAILLWGIPLGFILAALGVLVPITLLLMLLSHLDDEAEGHSPS